MSDKPCDNCGSIGGNVGCDVCGPAVRAKSRKWTHHTTSPENGEYIVETNFGDVFKLRFDGRWERPTRFNPGEKVEWWILPPNADGDGRREKSPPSPPTSSPFHPPTCSASSELQ